MFERAKRSQSRLRLALIGPSGSGKTYSSLLMAQGFGGNIAMLDTERGSGDPMAVTWDFEADVPPENLKGWREIRAMFDS